MFFVFYRTEQNINFIITQGPELQCFLKFKVDLKLRMESLAYENGHLKLLKSY